MEGESIKKGVVSWGCLMSLVEKWHIVAKQVLWPLFDAPFLTIPLYEVLHIP